MVLPARQVAAPLLLSLAALALGACGSSDDGTPTGAASSAATTTTSAATTSAGARYSARQVAKLAGLTSNPDGTWTNPTGCTVTKILLTRDEVLKNRTSPDALVVTNGADDVGVAFASKAGCREALLANLSQVK